MSENISFPWSKRMDPMFSVNAEEIAKRVLPIFGGTSPETTSTETAQTTQTPQTEKKDEEKSSDSGKSEPQKKEYSPEEVSSILEQVAETQAKLEEATKKLKTFESEQEKQKRAAMSKEEALQADYEQAQQIIVKLDAALKNQAVINAINGFKDIQFHDTKFVLNELKNSAPEIFEDMEVDLDGGTVTVSGVENHLRRIAKEKDWAVKKISTPENSNQHQNPTPVPRGSGAPPANPGLSGDKATRRKALAEKFPVISHGRRL
ncbi:head scaffolding protein [Mycobacterium phage Patience]|uniref:Scaffolding protein n=1 Tax=Mycobacterium phage Patience TaxID=1074308 RepID=G1JWD2_9CAUD|nr:head scaffolding protein [Mycobacterium phage Patience]AEL97930.1 hypothetical protein PATIENCE_21 [Mycobacterium phage Patience]